MAYKVVKGLKKSNPDQLLRHTILNAISVIVFSTGPSCSKVR